MARIDRTLGRLANAALRPVNLQLVRRGPAGSGYFPAGETVEAARLAGLSVSAYMEKTWGHPGNAKRTFDRLAEAGVLDPEPGIVCEIGPGSGRYVDALLQRSRPSRYEIYETATDWAAWLARTYPVQARVADGYTLDRTSDASVDLVHAHGVFVYVPFLTTYQYIEEMARVVRPGGWIVFDYYPERCLDDETVQRWLSSVHRFPCILPETYLNNLLTRCGCAIRATFELPFGPGRSLYVAAQRI